MINSTAVKICTLTLAIFMATGCRSKKSGPAAVRQLNAISDIEGYVVKPSEINETKTISGTIRPLEETVLMPEVSGRVVMINLKEGKFVRQGTVLIKLYDEDIQAQLHKAQAALELAEQTRVRQGELMKVSGISQLDYDQSVLQVHSIKADIEVLKVQIRKTEVHAPFDGVVGLRNVSLGAEVTPSTALATIRSVSQLKLDFSVPEKYSSQIVSGMKVLFTIQGDDRNHSASVMATEEGIDPGTRNLKVRALIDMDGTSFVPGTFANVELRLNENKNALMVPTQAIIPKEMNKQVIISRGGKAQLVNVKTRIRQESRIEVTEGIQPGDTVVTTGILFIKPGMKLNFSRVII